LLSICFTSRARFTTLSTSGWCHSGNGFITPDWKRYTPVTMSPHRHDQSSQVDYILTDWTKQLHGTEPSLSTWQSCRWSRNSLLMWTPSFIIMSPPSPQKTLFWVQFTLLQTISFIHFNIIILATLTSPKWSLSFRFSYQNFVCISCIKYLQI
jgi:hypothetical protein